ncbi:aminobenzoate synthetase (plasmid) [Rhodococcus erythropolis R138]|uniref:aminodeoxychorismate synthase component I n=1 Tax=Rhodococcus erythropolis TaxID=1833 RepID=UPI000492B1A4|nr:aminodeoxychorismate synthase component I [Rhodococcus erythropolis]ALU73482.1 aminobenzoate synthetase [Rhodococcus erythropolis R138]
MTEKTMSYARFDDLVAGAAMSFDSVLCELVAWRHDDVAAVLDQAQRLSDEGYWAFGFVAYEAASGLDPRLVTARPDPNLPLAWFGISHCPTRTLPVQPADQRNYISGPWTPNWSEQQHKRAVDTVRDRIADGETYQCNLTTKLTAHVEGDAADMYRDLALGQKGRYNAYLDIGTHSIVSASPELFFQLGGTHLSMRPMKGTAGRGRTSAEDDAAVAALLASEKERAENVMIVDLVRNDIARIARAGSVCVPTLFRTERYETVHQLTSDVTAEIEAGTRLSDIFRALFPCGSITGAPKQRTMELISELEVGPRGIYCGAIGVIAPAGEEFRAQFSVAIRTAVIDHTTDIAVYGAGGGITWGSCAHDEYVELLTKAEVLNARPRDFHLIETMRHHGRGVVKSLDAHLARAEGSAHYFGFDFDPARIRDAITIRLVGRSAASRIRLLLFRDGEFVIDESALPDLDSQPLRLALHPDPIDTATCWSRHKTSRREPYTQRKAALPDFDDVILQNERGEIMETCTGNLAVMVDDVWVTPPLDSGCLPGVERLRLLDNGTLREQTMTDEDLHQATRVAVINSLRGWRSAFVVAQKPVNG